MSEKYIDFNGLKEYNRQMKEAYIEPLNDKIDTIDEKNNRDAAELNGRITTVIFDITETNTEIEFQSLPGATKVDWGDGIINNNLDHTYTNIGKYQCKIYDLTDPRFSLNPSDQMKGKEYIKSIYLGETVTAIGMGSFYGCSNCTNITINNKVTTIGEYVFTGCQALTEITFPSGVTECRFGITTDLRHLKKIIFKNPTPPTFMQKIYDFSNSPYIYVPYGCKQVYMNALMRSDAIGDLNKIIEFDEEVITALLSKIKLDGDFISFDNSSNNFIKQVQTESYYIEDRSNSENRVGLHIQPTQLIKTVNDAVGNVLQFPTDNGTLVTEETVNNKIKALNINLDREFISFNNDENFIKQVQKESYYIEDRPNKYGLHIQPTRFIRTFNDNIYCTISLPTTDGKLATEGFVNNNINLKTNPNIDNMISRPVAETVSNDGYDYDCSGYYLAYKDNIASAAMIIEIHAIVTCSEDTPMSIAPSNKSTLIGTLTKYILPFFPVTDLITDAEIRARCVSNATFAQLMHYNLFTERNIANNSVGWLNGNGVSQPQLGNTTDAIYVRDFIVELDEHNKDNNLVVNGFEMVVKIYCPE